jgi:hypothetical protein
METTNQRCRVLHPSLLSSEGWETTNPNHRAPQQLRISRPPAAPTHGR